MTMYLVDVSRYQVERSDPLDLAKARAAGYSIANIALTGGDGYVSTAWASRYVAAARALGMSLSCYHWLSPGGGPGADQARVQVARMRALFGGITGFAHIVDVEQEGVTFAQVRDYVNAVQDALGRYVGIYTGDWFWPSAWNGRALTPFLMAAPNGGYVAAYPGDDSPVWPSGWGGWENRAIVQWGVKPLPGTGNCSLAAVRSPLVWEELSGGDRVASQAYYDWLADGQPWKFGRAMHATGMNLREHGYTVYFQGNDTHLKKDSPEDHTPFSASGWPGKSPYPYCMAFDLMPIAAGTKSKVTGQPLPSIQKIMGQLRADKIAGHPGAAWVKYLNWEPEGDNTGPCYHDTWTPDYARRSSTDRGHGHASSRTDFATSSASDDYDLVARVMGDDDEMDQNQFNTLMDSYVKSRYTAPDGTPAATARNYLRAFPWAYVGGGIPEGFSTLRVLDEVVRNGRDAKTTLEAVASAVTAGDLAAADRDQAMVGALLQALHEIRSSGGDPVSVEEVTEAFRRVLREGTGE
jgi:hypothetical protein